MVNAGQVLIMGCKIMDMTIYTNQIISKMIQYLRVQSVFE